MVTFGQQHKPVIGTPSSTGMASAPCTNPQVRVKYLALTRSIVNILRE